MNDAKRTISIDRCVGLRKNTCYGFWLIDSLTDDDSKQIYLYVNEDMDQEIQYVDIDNRYTWPMDSLFELSTPESVIQSLRVFHQEFLTKHGITIEVANTPVNSLELPSEFSRGLNY